MAAYHPNLKAYDRLAEARELIAPEKVNYGGDYTLAYSFLKEKEKELCSEFVRWMPTAVGRRILDLPCSARSEPGLYEGLVSDVQELEKRIGYRQDVVRLNTELQKIMNRLNIVRWLIPFSDDAAKIEDELYANGFVFEGHHATELLERNYGWMIALDAVKDIFTRLKEQRPAPAIPDKANTEVVRRQLWNMAEYEPKWLCGPDFAKRRRYLFELILDAAAIDGRTFTKAGELESIFGELVEKNDPVKSPARFVCLVTFLVPLAMKVFLSFKGRLLQTVTEWCKKSENEKLDLDVIKNLAEGCMKYPEIRTQRVLPPDYLNRVFVYVTKNKVKRHKTKPTKMEDARDICWAFARLMTDATVVGKFFIDAFHLVDEAKSGSDRPGYDAVRRLVLLCDYDTKEWFQSCMWAEWGKIMESNRHRSADEKDALSLGFTKLFGPETD
jgi:hypothetical protein